MSTETEQDLQRQINDETARSAAKIAKLEEAIKLIKKPELRHGDFGSFGTMNHIVIGGKVANKNLLSDHYGDPEIVYGNIFDLMEEAGRGGVIIAFSKESADWYDDTYKWTNGEIQEVQSKIQAARARQKGEL